LKKLKFLFFLFLFSDGLSSQIELTKLGVHASVFRNINEYNSNNSSWRSSNDINIKMRLGAEAYLDVPGRFSFTTGLHFDYMSSEFPRQFHIENDLHAELQEHNIVNMGIPLGIVLRTFTTRSCATYIKLNLINNFTVFESEQYTYFSDENKLVTRTTGLSSNSIKLDYYSTDIEFGFGTFWEIPWLKAQLSIEPKFSFLQFVNSNKVDNMQSTQLYDSYTGVYSSLGLQITMYKELD